MIDYRRFWSHRTTKIHIIDINILILRILFSPNPIILYLTLKMNLRSGMIDFESQTVGVGTGTGIESI